MKVDELEDVEGEIGEIFPYPERYGAEARLKIPLISHRIRMYSAGITLSILKMARKRLKLLLTKRKRLNRMPL
jgi:hypothetical protein